MMMKLGWGYDEHEHHPDDKDVDGKVGGGGLALGVARGLDRQPGSWSTWAPGHLAPSTWHKTR